MTSRIATPVNITGNSKQAKNFWLRARPYLILTAGILLIEFAVAYALDWSLFHVTEIAISQLEDEGRCMSLTVDNLLLEERVVEKPSLAFIAVGSSSIVRSGPIPLKLDGTSDDRILLLAGDQRRLCVSFESDQLKQMLIYKIQSFEEPKKLKCKFSVIVREPSRSHAHLYARVFNCVDRLTSLYQ